MSIFCENTDIFDNFQCEIGLSIRRKKHPLHREKELHFLRDLTVCIFDVEERLCNCFIIYVEEVLLDNIAERSPNLIR